MDHEAGSVDFALEAVRSGHWRMRWLWLGTVTQVCRGARGKRVIRARPPRRCVALGGVDPTRIAGR